MSNDILNVVNPQWINEPYSMSFLYATKMHPHWSRKRRLKALRRWRRKQKRERELMQLCTEAIVKASQKSLDKRLQTLVLAVGSVLTPRVFPSGMGNTITPAITAPSLLPSPFSGLV
jgi:hypothetical protein